MPLTRLPGPLGNSLALLIILTITGTIGRLTHRKKDEILNFLGSTVKTGEKSGSKGRLSAGERALIRFWIPAALSMDALWTWPRPVLWKGSLLFPALSWRNYKESPILPIPQTEPRPLAVGHFEQDAERRGHYDSASTIEDFEELSDVDTKIVRWLKSWGQMVITN